MSFCKRRERNSHPRFKLGLGPPTEKLAMPSLLLFRRKREEEKGIKRPANQPNGCLLCVCVATKAGPHAMERPLLSFGRRLKTCCAWRKNQCFQRDSPACGVELQGGRRAAGDGRRATGDAKLCIRPGCRWMRREGNGVNQNGNALKNASLSINRVNSRFKSPSCPREPTDLT